MGKSNLQIFRKNYKTVMYATRTLFKTVPKGLCLAQAYVIRKPLLQKQNQHLEQMYETLQTDTAINRSLLSDHELVQKQAAEIDKNLVKQRDLDATNSIQDIDVNEQNKTRLDETLYYTSSAVEWDGSESILSTAQRSAGDDQNLSGVIKGGQNLLWFSNAPAKCKTDKKTGNKTFIVPCYLEVGFEQLQSYNFSEKWSSKPSLAI